MSQIVLTGTRIRDRRIDIGMRQTDLAEKAGISPSYLNLIEHNRRRIGGKLLTDIASILDVDLLQLSEGIAGPVVAGLQNAADMAGEGGAEPERERTEEFARRFPGWAETTSYLAKRVEKLEETVGILTDRLAHDPNLSESLHEVLSTVTSIRSSADILADPEELDPAWQARFHKNIQEDARRLTEGAQALVSYLDNAPDTEKGGMSPQEELESWLAKNDFTCPEIENGGEVENVVKSIPTNSETSRLHAERYVVAYQRDRNMLPAETLIEAAHAENWDPMRISFRVGVDTGVVMRRMACLPSAELPAQIGRVSCDGAGVLTFRKPVNGFDVPHFGGACPVWPLFQALGRPMTPVRQWVEQANRMPIRYLAFAYARVDHPDGFDGPALVAADMILVPSDLVADVQTDTIQRVGQNCRICPRKSCKARREPTILGDGSN